MDIVSCPGCIQRDQRIAELEMRIAELEKSNAQLRADLARLRAQIEQVQRAGKRQAAPFSKGKPKEHPKSTARPSGAAYGKHGHRPPPGDDDIDETVDAFLPSCCPDCGGDLAEDGDVAVQFQEE